jgi:hypothetical protein
MKNTRRVICNSQEIRSQGLGKDQKLVSRRFDADVARARRSCRAGLSTGGHATNSLQASLAFNDSE